MEEGEYVNLCKKIYKLSRQTSNLMYMNISYFDRVNRVNRSSLFKFREEIYQIRSVEGIVDDIRQNRYLCLTDIHGRPIDIPIACIDSLEAKIKH